MWVLLRCALAIVGALLAKQLGPPPVSVGLPGSITIATMCGALVLLDVLRRREGTLLANLGTPLRMVLVVGATPAVIAEIAMTFVAAALTG
jgi:hypothetical protein